MSLARCSWPVGEWLRRAGCVGCCWMMLRVQGQPPKAHLAGQGQSGTQLSEDPIPGPAGLS